MACTLVWPFLLVRLQWIFSKARRTCCFVMPLATRAPLSSSVGATAALLLLLCCRTLLTTVKAAVPTRRGTCITAVLECFGEKSVLPCGNAVMKHCGQIRNCT